MPDETKPNLTAEEAQRNKAVAILSAERASLVKRNETNTARIAIIDQQLAALQPK